MTDLGDRSRWLLFSLTLPPATDHKGVSDCRIIPGERTGYVTDVESVAVPILMNVCAENEDDGF